jgi:2-isopropylmalate synthase
MPEIHIIDATRELGIIRFMKSYNPPFEVIGNYRLIDDGERPEATVQLKAGRQEMHEADIGVGPVDALANVLKKSLGRLFPDLPNVRLLDFEVHLIQGTIGTSAQVEVHIVFSDGTYAWKVSSSSDNINLASFRALLDGYEYAIYLWSKNRGAPRPRSGQVGRRAKGEGNKAVTPATRGRGKGKTDTKKR